MNVSQMAAILVGTRTIVGIIGTLVDMEVETRLAVWAVTPAPKGLADGRILIEIDMSKRTGRFGAPAISVIEAVWSVVRVWFVREVAILFAAFIFEQLELTERHSSVKVRIRTLGARALPYLYVRSCMKGGYLGWIYSPVGDTCGHEIQAITACP
jgi:hypothetical protein